MTEPPVSVVLVVAHLVLYDTVLELLLATEPNLVVRAVGIVGLPLLEVRMILIESKLG
jgi:hypothetical protein